MQAPPLLDQSQPAWKLTWASRELIRFSDTTPHPLSDRSLVFGTHTRQPDNQTTKGSEIGIARLNREPIYSRLPLQAAPVVGRVTPVRDAWMQPTESIIKPPHESLNRMRPLFAFSAPWHARAAGTVCDWWLGLGSAGHIGGRGGGPRVSMVHTGDGRSRARLSGSVNDRHRMRSDEFVSTPRTKGVTAWGKPVDTMSWKWLNVHDGCNQGQWSSVMNTHSQRISSR